MAVSTTTTHTDPVCGMQVDEAHAAGKSSHEGKDYYFCSMDCKAKFDRDPKAFTGTSPGRSGGCCD